ncbi:hypothetical protein CTAYLR_010690 [Chrysophaeum taylorii]|uniref:subtilisin n=1 Tax=Chrysophaeum taylorii TaxID=2483200 RepID=A0AAD7XGL2_9STRA|nr:hypothetical protein CTAYLR_010690 [Chrysophaeum taylorii]
MRFSFVFATVVVVGTTRRPPKHDRYVVRLCEERHREVVARRVMSSSSSEARHIRHLGALPALFVDASLGAIAELRGSEGVCDVSRVGERHAHLWTVQNESLEEFVAPAGGTRLPLDGDANRSRTGKGVNVFVLDTGLDTTHSEFGGTRDVLNVGSVVEGEEFMYWPAMGWLEAPSDESLLKDNDVYGHGTHCTGNVGGETLGVAPEANLYHIKVLSDRGWGSEEGVVAAFDAVAEVAPRLAGPTIVSVSLGGYCEHGDPSYCARESPESRAIASLRDLGVAVVVSAGNDGDDACFYTPAAAADAITVGASDYTDVVAWWSNYGSCVDIVGPGVDVALPQTSNLVKSEYYFEQDYIDDDAKTVAVSSGTSFSAPAVAGTLALYAELTGDVVNATAALLDSATTGVLFESPGLCATNDRLLRTPLPDHQRLERPSFSVSCAPPEHRPGWPYFYDLDLSSYSYSYDLACYDRCRNCTDVRNTSCGGACPPEETKIIWETVCEDDTDDDDYLGSYSYSYEFEFEVVPRVKYPRATRRGVPLDPGECAGPDVDASPAHTFDRFTFHASSGGGGGGGGGGSFVTYNESNSLAAPGACREKCDGRDDAAVSATIDPMTQSVSCRVCADGGNTAVVVDYAFYAIHSSLFDDDDFWQDTSSHMRTNQTIDFVALRAGTLRVAGECGVELGDEVWAQTRQHATDAFDGTAYDVSRGQYFSLVASKSVYEAVSHVRCTVLFKASSEEDLVTPPPTYFSTVVPTTPMPTAAPTTAAPTAAPTTAPTTMLGSTASPSENLEIEATSYFAVTGISLGDAEANTHVFQRAVASVAAVDVATVSISLSQSGRRRHLLVFMEDLEVNYAIATSIDGASRLATRILDITSSQLDDAIRTAAWREGRLATFAGVHTTYVHKNVDVVYGRNTAPAPTLQPAQSTLKPVAFVGSRKKKADEARMSRGAVVGIIVSITFALLALAASSYYAYLRKHRQRYS